jgi:hypothetical protein
MIVRILKDGTKVVIVSEINFTCCNIVEYRDLDLRLKKQEEKIPERFKEKFRIDCQRQINYCKRLIQTPKVDSSSYEYEIDGTPINRPFIETSTY